MKQHKPIMLWTLCPENTPGSRKVNPTPDGRQWIRLMPYTARQADAFREENEHGDPYNGYVVSISSYPKDKYGKPDFEEEESNEEHFFEPEDYVISEDGRLIGFFAAEDIVLWIDAFEKGGELYNTFGIPLRERTELCIDWDPITDEETEYEQTYIEYAFLTHSRW